MSFYIAWEFSKTSESGLHGLGLAPQRGSTRAPEGDRAGKGLADSLFFYPNGSVVSYFLENVLVGETSFPPLPTPKPSLSELVRERNNYPQN